MASSHEHSKVTPLVILALFGIFILVAMIGSVITNQQSRSVDRSFAQIAGAHPTRTRTPTLYRTRTPTLYRTRTPTLYRTRTPTSYRSTPTRTRTPTRAYATVFPTRTPTSRPDCTMTTTQCQVALNSGSCNPETHRCSSSGCTNGKVRCALRGSTGGGGLPTPTIACPGNPLCPNPTITPRVGRCGYFQADVCNYYTDYYGCSCKQCNVCVGQLTTNPHWELRPPTCSKGPEGSCTY